MSTDRHSTFQNRKEYGRWYRVTRGCQKHGEHPVHECPACQQATDQYENSLVAPSPLQKCGACGAKYDADGRILTAERERDRMVVVNQALARERDELRAEASNLAGEVLDLATQCDELRADLAIYKCALAEIVSGGGLSPGLAAQRAILDVNAREISRG